MNDLFQNKASDWDADTMKRELSQAIVAAIQSRINLEPGLAVMDFGAGTGLVTGGIASQVKSVAAVDTSPAMLEKLTAKEELRAKVTTHCQDILTRPLDLKFDLIVSAMTLHHVDDTSALLKTLYSHLKPGGKLAIADLDLEDGTFHPPETPGIFHLGFERQQLEELLQKSGFESIQFETAHTVERETKSYPIFLVTARRPE